MKNNFYKLVVLLFLGTDTDYLISQEDTKLESPENEIATDSNSESEQSLAAQQMTWDSYVEFGKNSDVSNEVSQGIKVEDILEKQYEYHYAAFGKVDPFKPPMLTASATSSTQVEIPIVSILQKYSIDELKIVGLWELKTGERKVLIMTPKDEGVVSVIGDMVGQKGGRILSIDKKAVVVREFSLTADGTREYLDLTMSVGEAKKDEKDSIIMKAGNAEAGYTNEELLPAGLLDNDPDIKARKEASVARIIENKKDPGNNDNKAKAIEKQDDVKTPEEVRPEVAKELHENLEKIEKQEEEKIEEIPVNVEEGQAVDNVNVKPE